MRPFFHATAAPLAALVLALGAWSSGCDRGQKTPAPAAVIDERLALLMDPSMARGPYDVDLSDVTPILVETLRIGKHEELRHAKMELAAGGERAVEAVGRFIGRYRSDPGGVDYLRNAADVLSLSPDPSATAQLLGLLQHPSESLRMQVMRGLLVHPRPESYEPALGVLANAAESYRAEVCAALAKFDLQRAQRLWLSWIENGDNPGLWPAILPYLGVVRDPELGARVRALLERGDLDPMARIWLSASACHGGDAARDDAALASLRRSRESRNPTERDLAVRALAAAERYDELGWTLAHDELAAIRALVVRAAAERMQRPEARQLVEQAANDADPLVSQPALTALAVTGAGEALDAAFSRLSSSTLAEVQSGIQILLEPMRRDAALAQRVWDLLGPRLESMKLRPSVERAMLFKILGQIPLRAGTRTLIDRALAESGDLEGTRAQRFILRQSVNAGRVAQEELAQLWRTRDDPLLRMDALEALSALGGDSSRELLLEILEDARATPSEIVYVADRLVRIGPAREVAWQLKRKALAMQDARAREALQGLLWRWYPPPAPAR